jgi:hypothetical protein
MCESTASSLHTKRPGERGRRQKSVIPWKARAHGGAVHAGMSLWDGLPREYTAGHSAGRAGTKGTSCAVWAREHTFVQIDNARAARCGAQTVTGFVVRVH